MAIARIDLDRQMSNNEDDFSSEYHETRIQEYLALLLRGKWVVLISIAVALAGAGLVTTQMKPVYEAIASVLVNAKGNEKVVSFNVASEGGENNKISNELAILKTRQLAESVAGHLLESPYLDEAGRETMPILVRTSAQGVSSEFASVEEVAMRLQTSLEFRTERESDIIKIVARSTNRKEAAILANTCAEVYQGQTTAASRTRSRSLREFLESRLKEQNDQLSKAEGSLKGFMESSNIVSLDGESNKIVQELSQLEASRNAVDIDIQTLSQKLATLQEELPQEESSVAASMNQANDPYIRILQEQLARLEVQRDVIVAQNDPNVLGQEMYARKLKGIEDQIATLQGKLKKKTADLIHLSLPGDVGSGSGQSDPVGYLKTLKQKIVETKLEVESQRSKKAALEGIIKEYEAKFQNIPRQSLQFAKLQRERLSSEKLYTLVEERFNEAAITEKSEFGYVDIIDRAVVPRVPASPNLSMNLLFGLLLGIGAGLGIVMIKELMDVRVRIPEQLLRKGYRPLTEVAPMERELRSLPPDERVNKEFKRFSKRIWLIFNPISFLAESYRRLRTALIHIRMKKALQVIVVTSPNPGEGKTTTICNLAIAFAETGKRVLLIDADLRRPTVHTTFNCNQHPGLTDHLFGKSPTGDIIQKGIVENLDIVSCGYILKNPARVFGAENLRTFIAEMRSQYDWILIDAPPILVVNDAAALAAMVDGTVMVVSSGLTRFAAVERAVGYLQSAGGVLLGTVLNNFSPQGAYGSYYGGSRYGHYTTKDGYYTRPTAPKERHHG